MLPRTRPDPGRRRRTSRAHTRRQSASSARCLKGPFGGLGLAGPCKPLGTPHQLSWSCSCCLKVTLQSRWPTCELDFVRRCCVERERALIPSQDHWRPFRKCFLEASFLSSSSSVCSQSHTPFVSQFFVVTHRQPLAYVMHIYLPVEDAYLGPNLTRKSMILSITNPLIPTLHAVFACCPCVY